MNKLVKTAVLLLALSVMALSGYKLLEIFSEYDEGEKVYSGAVEDYIIWEESKNGEESSGISGGTSDPSVGDNETNAVVDENEPDEEVFVDVSAAFTDKAPIEIDFDALTKEYPDVIGWIYCKDTPISYPVVQGNDNDYYLYRTYNSKDNKAGSIFMDFRNDSDFSNLNNLVYGHNMKNDTMFGTLKDYYSQKHYYDHPVMWLLTPDKNYRLDLIAGKIVDITSPVYTIFENSDELSEHVSWLTKYSSFKTQADLNSLERIVTLSTCTSAGDDNERYVVVCSMVEVD